MVDEKWKGISARCEEGLLKAIQEEVERTGKRRQKVIVQALEKGLDIAQPSVDAKPLINELKSLRLALVPLGANMNQIAYAFNSQQYLNRDDLKINHDLLAEQVKKIIIKIRGIERELYRRDR